MHAPNTQMIVFSIGHSSRSLREFTRILRAYDIILLVDVRRYPTSSRFPWFRRRELELALLSHGISYIWLGEYLGGLGRDMSKWVEEKLFWVGVHMLISYARSLRKGYACFMCAERIWLNCHRKYIADALTVLGVKVKHIIDVRTCSEHTISYRVRRKFEEIATRYRLSSSVSA